MKTKVAKLKTSLITIGDGVGAAEVSAVGSGVGAIGATNGWHSQSPISGGRMPHSSSEIRPLKPLSCRTLQKLKDGWPEKDLRKIASGLVIQEPVPQIEQPPSGGISGQAPDGVGSIRPVFVGAGVGGGGSQVGLNVRGDGEDGGKVGKNALHSQSPIS